MDAIVTGQAVECAASAAEAPTTTGTADDLHTGIFDGAHDGRVFRHHGAFAHDVHGDHAGLRIDRRRQFHCLVLLCFRRCRPLRSHDPLPFPAAHACAAMARRCEATEGRGGRRPGDAGPAAGRISVRTRHAARNCERRSAYCLLQRCHVRILQSGWPSRIGLFGTAAAGEPSATLSGEAALLCYHYTT